MSAFAGGWPALDAHAEVARAQGLARTAGVKSPGTGIPGAAGLSVGYLRGSAGLLARPDRGEGLDDLAGRLRWSRWSPAAAGSLFPAERMSVSLGLLRLAGEGSESSLLQGLDIVAHFAIEGAPHFAPFHAWGYTAAGQSRRASVSPPIAFEAAAPNRVALRIDYALDSARVAGGVVDCGSVFVPLGGRSGAGAGLYVLAAPSRRTGRIPDLRRYLFSGDVATPLAGASGAPVDFDYLAVAIRPVAA